MEKTRKLWADPEYRERINREAQAALNPERRERMRKMWDDRAA